MSEDEITEDQLWKRLSLVSDWIKVADAKSSFLIVISLAVYGYIFKMNDIDQIWEKICISIAFIANSCTLLFAIKANLPRLSKSAESPGLIYFNDIAGIKKRRFLSNLLNQSGSKSKDDLAEQIYEISQVAKNKMFWLSISRWSIFITVAAFIPFLFKMIFP